MVKIGFFEDAPSSKSMARLQAFMLVASGIYCVVYACMTSKDTASISSGITLITLGLGIKIWSKEQEKTINVEPTK